MKKIKIVLNFFHCISNLICSSLIFFRPEAQCTDLVRGKTGFSWGRHSWDIWWKGPVGTVAMVGVATQHEIKRLSGYKPLLGGSGESWAWNLVDNHMYHGGRKIGNYPNSKAGNHLQRYNVRLGY